MKPRIKPASRVLISPPVVVFFVSLVLIVVGLFFTHRIRPYNSDDVSWQNILFTWRPFNGQQITLGGSDNFILKVPLFALLSHFFSASRKLLFLESSILAVTTFTFFYIASLYFLRRARIALSYVNLLPFVWLASFGYAFDQLYLNPILRNFEIGLSFILFMLVAIFYKQNQNISKSKWSIILYLIIAISAGLLIYNDPYFLYFTIVPLALFSGALFLLKKINKQQILVVYAGIVVSLLAAKLTALFAVKAGIKLVSTYPVEFISFDKLFNNIALALHGLLIIFGADFFGNKAISLVALSALINALILGFIVYKILQIRRDAYPDKIKQLTQEQLWTIFFGFLSIFVFLVYTVSTLVINIATYRYFVILVFSAVLFLSTMIGSLHKFGRSIITLVLAGAIVFNIAMTISGNVSFVQTGAAGNRRNAVNYDLIHTLRDRGLTKGYANYWQGNINTYLSQNQIQFLPVYCANGRTLPFHFLITEDSFNKPASKSFYIIDPDNPSPPTCTQEQLVSQFGQPKESFMIADKTVLFYDYDLITKMQ